MKKQRGPGHHGAPTGDDRMAHKVAAGQPQDEAIKASLKAVGRQGPDRMRGEIPLKKGPKVKRRG